MSSSSSTGSSSSSFEKRDSVSSVQQTLSALVTRLLAPQYHDHFVFSLKPDLVSDSSTNLHDTFRISNVAGNDNKSSAKIEIEGATMAGLGAGLNYYLREICQVDMSWSGDRLHAMPSVPPEVPQTKGVIRASFVPWRYYINVVTFGYSFAFWDWERWQRELDWMFLNGINMALSMVGQEYVFRHMYESLGLTREELNNFFSGPAYMPWQRMGNIQGSWSLTNDTQFKNDWIDSQWELQGHIMSRMHDFNITAIMPSFNGFVPRELANIFPDVKFANASDWGAIEDPYSRVSFVSPSESLFVNLTQRLFETQTSLYEQMGLGGDGTNTHNYYLLDLYNELSPVCMTSDCLRGATSGVMKAMKIADPKAVWVMQSWFLLNTDLWKTVETKAFFDGIREVNDGRDAFVIDLYADVKPLWNETDGFFGIDWGWSMLNNFGGGQGLYGTLPTLLTEPFRGFQQSRKVMRGMGITMEGINNNEYMYQVVLDIPWESVEATLNLPSEIASPNNTTETQPLDQLPLDGQKHLEAYLRRRYGPNQTSSAVIEAWTTLSQTVWDCRTNQMAQSRSYLDITPALDMYRSGFMSTKFWYNQSKVVKAWGQLVQSTETAASKTRRGHGMLQNSVQQVLRIGMGQASLDTSSQEAQSEDLLASLPVDSRERKAALSKSFSERIRDAIKNTLGQMTDNRNRINADDNPTSFATLLKRSAAPALSEVDLPLNESSFRYDIVDVTREIMVAVVIPGLHKELVDAYKAKDLARTRSWGNLILESIKDTDRILATHTHFMLGPWINAARISAKIVQSTSPTLNATINTTGYADYIEHSARNQITWWGPTGQQGLDDYASKEWSGLVKGYFYPRWQIFVDRLVTAVKDGHTLDYKAYLADSLKVQADWIRRQTCLGNDSSSNTTDCQGKETFPVEPVEDTTLVAQDLWDRWNKVAARLAAAADQ
ncbi:hypothetical protein BGZ98_008286 [Dissophora globulifera]|nr:hypothetical protein BGZ98_008286 [Dissophora globulifera]